MTTPIGHSFAALIVYFFTSSEAKKKSVLLFLAVFIASIAPDFDYFPVLWGDLKLANYNHQGFTHSLTFVLTAAIVVALIAKWFGLGSARKLYPFFALAGVSHLLLDYLTYDGRDPVGIPLLWPITDIRFNSPISVFGGFAKGSFADLVSYHNLLVIAREFLILGIPMLVIWYLASKKMITSTTDGKALKQQ